MAKPLTQLPLQEAPLAFLDVETTGLRPELGHRVVEIALLRSHGLEKQAKYTTLINPGRPLDPGAMRVNGITPNMVAGAPSFAQIIPKLEELLADAIIVAHNAQFDMGFLQMEYDIAKIPLNQHPILDTLMLARRQYHFYSNSLGNIARQLNIAAPSAHRAMGDVLTTYSVLRRFSGDLKRKNRPLVEDWIRMQGGIAWAGPKNDTSLEENHPLQIALTESRSLKIQYKGGSGHITERIITPISHSGQFVVAHCHLRGAQRTFRLDRITRMELQDK